MPLSTLFQSYRGGQFYWRWKAEYLEKTTPATSHCQTYSHKVVSSAPCHEQGLTTLVVIGTDCTGSCKSNYHMIMKQQPRLYYKKVSVVVGKLY
jgi:hypothetical protein